MGISNLLPNADQALHAAAIASDLLLLPAMVILVLPLWLTLLTYKRLTGQVVNINE